MLGKLAYATNTLESAVPSLLLNYNLRFLNLTYIGFGKNALRDCRRRFPYQRIGMPGFVPSIEG